MYHMECIVTFRLLKKKGTAAQAMGVDKKMGIQKMWWGFFKIGTRIA